MVNLQFKTNSLKIGSSVPSISLNYGRNLTKRSNAGSGNVRDAWQVFTVDALPALVNLARVVPTLWKWPWVAQDEVLRLAEKGHKILLTGFPGTGKTKLHVVVNIVNNHVVGRREGCGHINNGDFVLCSDGSWVLWTQRREVHKWLWGPCKPTELGDPQEAEGKPSFCKFLYYHNR